MGQFLFSLLTAIVPSVVVLVLFLQRRSRVRLSTSLLPGATLLTAAELPPAIRHMLGSRTVMRRDVLETRAGGRRVFIVDALGVLESRRHIVIEVHDPTLRGAATPTTRRSGALGPDDFAGDGVMDARTMPAWRAIVRFDSSVCGMRIRDGWCESAVHSSALADIDVAERVGKLVSLVEGIEQSEPPTRPETDPTWAQPPGMPQLGPAQEPGPLWDQPGTRRENIDPTWR